MKKLFILAMTLLVAGSAGAQLTGSIGYISTTTNNKFEQNIVVGTLTSSGSTTMSGLSVGIDDNINITGDLNIAPGFEFKFASTKEDDIKKTKVGVDIPVDINYGIALGSDLKLFVFAGPTFDLGLVNNAKDDNDNEVNYYDENTTVNYSRFDVLLGGGAWITFQDQFRLKVGYKAGLLDTCKPESITSKSNMFFVSVGFLF